MSLDRSNYLKNNFIDNVRDALTDSEVKKTVSDIFGSYKGPGIQSHISSFGIGMGLAFLGEYLATKKKGSPTVSIYSTATGNGC